MTNDARTMCLRTASLPTNATLSQPPPRRPQPSSTDNKQDYDPEQVGRTMYDSIKILGLGFGATGSEVEDEVPKQLSHYYHPDRWDPIRTNMTLDQSTAHFQRHNNAHSYIRQILELF